MLTVHGSSGLYLLAGETSAVGGIGCKGGIGVPASIGVVVIALNHLAAPYHGPHATKMVCSIAARNVRATALAYAATDERSAVKHPGPISVCKKY